MTDQAHITLSPDDFDVEAFVRTSHALAFDALHDAWKNRYRHPLKARKDYRRHLDFLWIHLSEDGQLRFLNRTRLRSGRDVALHLDRVDEDGWSDWQRLVEIIDAKLAT